MFLDLSGSHIYVFLWISIIFWGSTQQFLFQKKSPRIKFEMGNKNAELFLFNLWKPESTQWNISLSIWLDFEIRFTRWIYNSFSLKLFELILGGYDADLIIKGHILIKNNVFHHRL